jgi:hypothetical protein
MERSLASAHIEHTSNVVCKVVYECGAGQPCALFRLEGLSLLLGERHPSLHQETQGWLLPSPSSYKANKKKAQHLGGWLANWLHKAWVEKTKEPNARCLCIAFEGARLEKSAPLGPPRRAPALPASALPSESSRCLPLHCLPGATPPARPRSLPQGPAQTGCSQRAAAQPFACGRPGGLDHVWQAPPWPWVSFLVADRHRRRRHRPRTGALGHWGWAGTLLGRRLCSGTWPCHKGLRFIDATSETLIQQRRWYLTKEQCTQ